MIWISIYILTSWMSHCSLIQQSLSTELLNTLKSGMQIVASEKLTTTHCLQADSQLWAPRDYMHLESKIQNFFLLHMTRILNVM